MQILLSNSQAGPGRTVKQGQEEISRNHVQAFIPGSVEYPEWIAKITVVGGIILATNKTETCFRLTPREKDWFL